MTNPYIKELRGWDWDAIVAECKNNTEHDDDGNLVGACYISSMPWPSGKFYMPWATSNLNPCPGCDGTGKSKQPTQLWKVCPNCKGTTIDSCQRVAEATGETPEEVYIRLYGKHQFLDEWRFVCWRCDGKGRIQPSCSVCGGCGSHEAYRDELWFEAAETVAGEHGCYTFTGEGDPCDFFIGMTLEEHVEEEQ